MGFGACCLGPGFFWIPGLGQLLVAGPIVSWIVGALEGAVVVGGLGVVGAGLYGLGIPKDSIVKYETAIKTGKFVLIAHGSRRKQLGPTRSSAAPARNWRNTISRDSASPKKASREQPQADKARWQDFR